jgi:hypothetical protein
MYFSVVEAEYVGDHRILLRFQDGSAGMTDLSSYADPSTVFSRFLDQAYFAAFRIEHGTLVWGQGELDIAPEALYERATGKPVRYRNTATADSAGP